METGYKKYDLVTHVQNVYIMQLQTQKNLLILCIYIILSQWANGQWQTWNSIAANASLTDKLDVRLSHLRGFEFQPQFQNHFNQTGLSLTYRLSKRWDAGTGILFITPTSNKDTRTRLFLRASHTHRINKQLNWINGIRLETNSANENRFRHRVIISSRVGMRKRTEFLAMKASTGYLLFYNIGGRPIKYYDEKGELIASNTPDGFHRGRLFINLDFKLNKVLNLDINYFNQHEFNLLASPTRKMNVPNANGRIQRPFDNYNMIGASLTVNIDKLIK